MSEQDLSKNNFLPASAETATSSTNGKSGWSNTQTYITVGVVAAAVSAAVAYAVWSRYNIQHQESVQELLDEAHDKVRSIEKRLGDLRSSVTPETYSVN